MGTELFVYLIIGALAFFSILYFVVKAAVRDGIVEARQITDKVADEDTIAEIICPECGKHHAMDYAKCPHCEHTHFGL